MNHVLPSILLLTTTMLLAGTGIYSAEDAKLDLKQLHPKMFEMVLCHPSDTQQPVVTELNLDAIRRNRNQFDFDAIRSHGDWWESPGENGQGFHRIRLRGSAENVHRIEYQVNAGGTLTTNALIECLIESKSIQIDGKPTSIRILKIVAISQ